MNESKSSDVTALKSYTSEKTSLPAIIREAYSLYRDHAENAAKRVESVCHDLNAFDGSMVEDGVPRQRFQSSLFSFGRPSI